MGLTTKRQPHMLCWIIGSVVKKLGIHRIKTTMKLKTFYDEGSESTFAIEGFKITVTGIHGDSS